MAKLEGSSRGLIVPLAVDVSFTADALRVALADGREISVPLEWFPRLRDATAAQRKRWRLIRGGIGIHWDAVDEDISVEYLLSVQYPSPEAATSTNRATSPRA